MMVAIVLDYGLFEILKSIDLVESYVWLPLCLSPRMHEGQKRVPGEYTEEDYRPVGSKFEMVPFSPTKKYFLTVVAESIIKSQKSFPNENKCM